MMKSKQNIILGSVTFIVILLAWEIISRRDLINVYLIPPPTKIFSALFEWVSSKEFLIDFSSSLWRGVVGFAIGGIIGVALGLITGRIAIASHFLSPLMNVVRSFPPVSLIPVFITFFGIGDFSKTFSIAFASVFPIWVNTHIGASLIPVEYIRSGKLLAGSKAAFFFRVVFPASLGSIVAGSRISISVAFVMLYVSELAGASNGLGYQISSSHLAYRMDKMFAALFVLGATAAIVDLLYVRSVKFFFPWLKLNGVK